ncbi:MAG: hypothetical protein KDA41_17540 [Planctomycetales bacterium]|nr:hypothetical protein [Planctomycetales bacterium]
MIGLCIQDLADIVGGRLRLADMPPLGGASEPVRRVVLHVDEVQPGDVLLALPNSAASQPGAVEAAYARGACGVIAAGRPLAPWPGAFSIDVDDAAWTLWQLARALRQGFDKTVIGVAGPVGKTTTAAMIAAVLDQPFAAAPPAPGAHEEQVAAQLLSLDERQRAAVIELPATSHGQFDAQLHLACPQVGVLTSPGGPQETTSAAGMAHDFDPAADLLSALPDDGALVLDQHAARRTQAVERLKNCLTFGREASCDVSATHVLCEPGRLSFVVDGQLVRLPVWGRSHLNSALAAWCVGRQLGIADATIAARLANYRAPAGTCRVTSVADVAVIENSGAGSTQATSAALELLGEFSAPGRRIVLVDRIGAQAHYDDAAADEFGRQAVVLGGADAVLASGTHRQKICEAAARHGVPASACKAFDALAESVSYAAQIVQAGDVVLLQGVDGAEVQRLLAAMQFRKNDRQAA